MPFDGTHFDEATQTLIAARQLLIDKGWCTQFRNNFKGEYCALGAMDAVMGQGSDYSAAAIRLAAAVPRIKALDILRHNTFFFPSVLAPLPTTPGQIAIYNNKQTDIKPILKWFDRAIAAGG